MEINFNIEDLPEVAATFIENIKNDSLFAFEGEMGAGKTTFIVELCRRLGANDDFGSPTFSLVNEYLDINGKPIYHFDFYRIDSPDEAMDIGVEDYFYSGNLCFIEWPEKIGALLPEETRKVNITVNPDGSRKIIF